jgi:hypothetical protein
MKFVLVNDKTPKKRTFCALCGEPIGAGYLREIGTQLCYCDPDCYTDHCKSAITALADFARASLTVLALNRLSERTETKLTAK